MLDSHSRAVNTSLFWPSAGRDLSAGDVFHHYLNQPDSDPYISSPETGLLSGDQTFFLTRRIVGRDGHFASIVSGTISLQYFSDFFRAVDGDGSAVISLLRRDGTFLVRYPRAPALTGRRLPDEKSWHGVAAAGGGLYDASGFATGVSRSISVHPLRNYPMVVDVGTDNDIALADWQRQALYIGLGSAVVISTLLGFFYLLRTQFRRLADNAGDLRDAVAALRHSQAALAAFAR